MARLKLSPGGLYSLLTAELRARRITPCSCQMPLPMFIDRPDEVSANWRIGTPAPCARGCHLLILEVAASMWPKYDLHEAAKLEPKVNPPEE